MAATVLRQAARAPLLVQQCSRLIAASHRSYADMAFTFASPYDVSIELTKYIILIPIRAALIRPRYRSRSRYLSLGLDLCRF